MPSRMTSEKISTRRFAVRLWLCHVRLSGRPVIRHLAASIPDSFRSIPRNAYVIGRETDIGLYSGYLRCLRGVSLCRVKLSRIWPMRVL
nr:MAG TPA: hypothetical protein [Caudoviricetes sp.]